MTSPQGETPKKTPPTFAAMTVEFALLFVPIMIGINWAWNAAMKEPFDLGPQFRPARAGFVEICRSLLGSG